MKIRIISGATIILIAAAVLGASLKYTNILPVAFAILGVIAVKELLYTTGIVKNKLITVVGAVLAAIVPFVFTDIIPVNLGLVYTVFAVIQFALYLGFHKEIKIEGMFGMILLPIVISYGFSSFCSLAGAENVKLFYVILVLCWSAVADTGAYFVGVLCGKHKMSPNISPKKTWEGLAGGMIFSLLVIWIVCILYRGALGVEVNTVTAICVTPVFMLIGVLGDLTASLIKRQCQIKDFGKIIPGHGGIMDRFDSILMIAPLFYQVVTIFPFVK